MSNPGKHWHGPDSNEKKSKKQYLYGNRLPKKKKKRLILHNVSFNQSRPVHDIATTVIWRHQYRFMVLSNHSLRFTNYSVCLMVLKGFAAVRHFIVFRHGFNN